MIMLYCHWVSLVSCAVNDGLLLMTVWVHACNICVTQYKIIIQNDLTRDFDNPSRVTFSINEKVNV